MNFRLLILGVVALAVVWWEYDDISLWWHYGYTSNEKAQATEKEIAACKVKAMELYKGMEIGTGEPAEYLQTCMRAAGYLPDAACWEGIWDQATCYYPDTPLWRQIKEKQGVK
jgi:hypothetical protein